MNDSPNFCVLSWGFGFGYCYFHESFFHIDLLAPYCIKFLIYLCAYTFESITMWDRMLYICTRTCMSIVQCDSVYWWWHTFGRFDRCLLGSLLGGYGGNLTSMARGLKWWSYFLHSLVCLLIIVLVLPSLSWLTWHCSYAVNSWQWCQSPVSLRKSLPYFLAF